MSFAPSVQIYYRHYPCRPRKPDVYAMILMRCAVGTGRLTKFQDATNMYGGSVSFRKKSKIREERRRERMQFMQHILQGRGRREGNIFKQFIPADGKGWKKKFRHSGQGAGNLLWHWLETGIYFALIAFCQYGFQLHWLWLEKSCGAGMLADCICVCTLISCGNIYLRFKMRF